MPRFLHMLAAATFVALAASPTIAERAEPDRPDPSRLVRVAADDALAYGPGGTFTRDAAEAFVEALEFTLAELGEPTNFGPDLRAEVHQALAAGFGGLPLDDQIALAEFRNVWTLTRQGWATLPLENKRQFAWAVLALAFGEEAADRAVGSAGGGSGTRSPIWEDEMNEICARHGGCGGAMDGLNSYVPSYE